MIAEEGFINDETAGVRRRDHFAGSREVRQGPPEGGPVVLPGLVEWLRDQGFGQVSVAVHSYPANMDQVIQTANAVTYAAGQRSVIEALERHLKQEG